MGPARAVFGFLIKGYRVSSGCVFQNSVVNPSIKIKSAFLSSIWGHFHRQKRGEKKKCAISGFNPMVLVQEVNTEYFNKKASEICFFDLASSAETICAKSQRFHPLRKDPFHWKTFYFRWFWHTPNTILTANETWKTLTPTQKPSIKSHFIWHFTRGTISFGHPLWILRENVF